MSEYATYNSNSEFMGYWDEDQLHPLIAKQEARLIKKKKSDGRIDVRVVLSAVATDRVRMLNTGHAGPALRTVQVEEVYTGCRREEPVTVTGRVRTLMKVRNGRFVPWGENDVFPPNRFNPDKIRHPLFAR